MWLADNLIIIYLLKYEFGFGFAIANKAYETRNDLIFQSLNKCYSGTKGVDNRDWRDTKNKLNDHYGWRKRRFNQLEEIDTPHGDGNEDG